MTGGDFGPKIDADSAVPPPSERLLLAIESSCDETAAAVISRDLQIRSNVVASQFELHERFSGVVPEIASRAHLRNILPVIDQALSAAECRLADIEAIAVANEPGLVGSLLIGLTAAKTLAMACGVPLVPVNHIEAHLYACRMAAGRDIFPAVGLVVSGGHSNLYLCGADLRFELLGATIDDAAGEAFDKVASLLELGFPGGPAISRIAERGDPTAFDFPRSFIHDERLDFSFSGLKTAVRYAALGTPGSGSPPPPLTEQRIADLAASFQEAVVDVLVEKSRQAMVQTGLKVLCVGGGVAANRRLRDRLQEMVDRDGGELHLAAADMCTDNAAMAAIAWEALEQGRTGSLGMDVTPGLVRHPRG